jgi:hypothetical protein
MFQLAEHDEKEQQTVYEGWQSSPNNIAYRLDQTMGLLKTMLSGRTSVPVPEPTPTYIVVDGLDEIKPETCETLLENLLSLASELDKVRILFSSRVEAHISAVLDSASTYIRIDQHWGHGGSIRKFVDQWSQKWFAKRASTQWSQSERHEIESLFLDFASKAKGRRAPLLLCMTRSLTPDHPRHVPVCKDCPPHSQS